MSIWCKHSNSSLNTHCITISYTIFNQMTASAFRNITSSLIKSHLVLLHHRRPLFPFNMTLMQCNVSFMQTFSHPHYAHIVCNWISSQIVALNKTKERMRPYHVYHENEDPDIKKIKKVNKYFLKVIPGRASCVCFFMSMLHCTACLYDRVEPCVLLLRCKVSCGAGSVGGSGRSSFRTTSALLTLRAWGRGTRSSSTWWRQRQSM